MDNDRTYYTYESLNDIARKLELDDPDKWVEDFYDAGPQGPQIRITESVSIYTLPLQDQFKLYVFNRRENEKF